MKKYLILFLAAVLTFSLCGCGEVTDTYFNTLEEAQKAARIKLSIPDDLFNSTIETYHVDGKKLTIAFFSGKVMDAKVIKAKEINAEEYVYNYDKIVVIATEGESYRLYQHEKKVNMVWWNADGYDYLLLLTVGVDSDAAVEICKQIK